MNQIGWISAVLCCVALLTLWVWSAKRLDAARLEAEAARTSNEANLRLLRLSATDQRNVALSLFGHAAAANAPDGSLAGLARRLFDMADTLTQQTDTAAPRFVADEDMALLPVIQFAAEQVAAHLGPSRRAWRLDPAFSRIRLRADRRALNQVLVNALSGAAASTRDGDWIDLSAERTADHFAILVQDEGVGLPVAQNDPHPRESRGIGLRLTLARSLMQAHGGNLIVDSVERVGTSVRLEFPIGRLVEWHEDGKQSFFEKKDQKTFVH